MPKGFDLRCGAGRSARVWMQGKGGQLRPGQAFVLLRHNKGEGEDARAGYIALLRQALIHGNRGRVNVVVSQEDYHALKRGIGNLGAAVQ